MNAGSVRMIMTTTRCIRAVCLVAFMASNASGQTSDRDPRPLDDAGRVMSILRANGSVGTAVRTLRMAHEAATDLVVDALADSLTEFIIAEAGNPELHDARSRARDALGASGWLEGEGKPYGGAGVRLIRVAAADVTLAGGALYYVSILADQDEAIKRLSDFARSTDISAHMAITMLGEMMGQRGVEALRALYRGQLVQEASAKRKIENFAQVHGWQTDRDP